MSLKPRHYALLAVLVGLTVFNLFRARYRPTPPPLATNVSTLSETEFAWKQYDHAAALRDADSSQFSTALQTFDNSYARVPSLPGAHDREDMQACRLWLSEYRNPTSATMHSLATRHIATCAQQHVDRAE
jgi:hypothetical protein